MAPARQQQSSLGSARASRAGECALAFANFPACVYLLLCVPRTRQNSELHRRANLLSQPAANISITSNRRRERLIRRSPTVTRAMSILPWPLRRRRLADWSRRSGTERSRILLRIAAQSDKQ